MGKTEYRNVREVWDNEHLDAHGNPTRRYEDSYFDDSNDRKASATNRLGIFLKDGHYQMKTVKETGYGRTVYEDTYEEDVEISYSWLSMRELYEMLRKDEVITVPNLSDKEKGSTVKVGNVHFPMNPKNGRNIRVYGLLIDESFLFMEDGEDLIGELVIPGKVKGMDIKCVGGFSSCKGITRLVLSEGITNLNEYAFWGCNNLQEIVFPKTISWLKSYCFDECHAIKLLVIPDEVRMPEYGRSWYYTFKQSISSADIARYDGDPEPEHLDLKSLSASNMS